MLFNLLQAGITLNCWPKKWPVSWFAINRKAIMQWKSRGSHRIVSHSQVELRIPWRQMFFKKRAWLEALCVLGLDHTSFCLCRKFTYTFIVLSTCLIAMRQRPWPSCGFDMSEHCRLDMLCDQCKQCLKFEVQVSNNLADFRQ
jgi:hypothetical protein